MTFLYEFWEVLCYVCNDLKPYTLGYQRLGSRSKNYVAIYDHAKEVCSHASRNYEDQEGSSEIHSFFSIFSGPRRRIAIASLLVFVSECLPDYILIR